MKMIQNFCASPQIGKIIESSIHNSNPSTKYSVVGIRQCITQCNSSDKCEGKLILREEGYNREGYHCPFNRNGDPYFEFWEEAK